MQKAFFEIIIERDANDVYFAKVPELPGCYSQADSLDELQDNIKEAIEAYLEAQTKKVKPLSRFIGIQRIEVAVH